MRSCIDFMLMRFRRESLTILGFIAIVLGCGALVLGALLITVSPVPNAGAASVVLPSPTCHDFTSWELATDHFEDIGPDSFEARILDSNGNGIPCEGLIARTSLPHEEFDVICDDFQHRDEAEYFFDQYDAPNSNLYGLDRDLDGRPCETLPPLDDTLRVLNRLNRQWHQDFGFGGDLNCTDFETWIEANDLFVQAGGPGSDPHKLDGDSDGVPCESLPGAP